MKKRDFKRIVGMLLAGVMTVQCAGDFIAVQAKTLQVHSESTTQMASNKEVVYVNTYDASKREQNFDENWKFNLGDVSGAESATFDDSRWRTVSVPHDYSIEQDYTKSGEAESAYLPGGIGWYRKYFTVSEDMKGKEVRIDFGGVYMDSTVWVNGHELGNHPNGYTTFSYDITEYLKFDEENVIAVKVNHQTPSSRWYSGSGIYRSVNLTVMNKVHVGLYGTQITTPNLAEQKEGNVDMNIKTTVVNEETTAQDVVLTHTLYKKGSTNAVVTKSTDATTVQVGAEAVIDTTLQVNKPDLWGVGEENAHLYIVRTEVKIGENIVDSYDTEYGFRYTSYDADRGFYLNGTPMKLKGVCMHHDQGSLGAEAYYRAIERQVEILQEMGCNSIRVTHNPASDELIEICNEKGILVIDELFDGWMYPKNSNSSDYARFFNKQIGAANKLIGAKAEMTWAEFDLKATINRGKNAPSIIMWSLGNEIQEGCTGSAVGWADKAKELIRWAQEVDTTRELTIGSNAAKNQIGNANNDHIQIMEQLQAIGGVAGTNYSDGNSYDRFHSTYPNWFLYGSETASSVNSRGVYNRTMEGNAVSAGMTSDKQLTSYDG